ncbi:glycosyltransferase [Micromonospora qiuiae]|uniref:glycosyltransferase n=1 Tax=Micromonospora qiuiae TaxID=502268 RepID=UPI00195291CA|nr:glycosyltransferase [Micromonospora qiuiae]
MTRLGGEGRFGARALAAFSVNGLSSIGNLVVSVTVARGEPLARLGQFALALSIYVLATGLIRTSITEAVLAPRPGSRPAEVGAGAGRACLVGSVTGGAVVVVGAVLGSPYLVIAGLALPGLVLCDYIKAINLGVGQTRVALVQECIWTGCSVAAVLSALLAPVAPVVVFGAWAAAGALTGFGVAVQQDYPVLPRWGLDRHDTRVAGNFAAQFLVTIGSSQVALSALAAAGGVVGVSIVGAIGAARTIFGPVTLLMATLSSLIVPYLARARPVTRRARLRTTGLVNALAVGLIAPAALAVCLLPDGIGEAMLGANWSAARPLLLLLAVEAVLAPIATVGFAGHRVQGAAGRALLIGCVLGPMRILLFVSGGVLYGAQGAVAALAVLAALTAACWWLSYLTVDASGGHSAAGRPSGTTDSPACSTYRVLATVGAFEPGFRGGGPVRSVAWIADTLPADIELLLVTADHDLGCAEPYPELSGRWIRRNDECDVFYLSPKSLPGWLRAARRIRSRPLDLLYVNSLWSRYSIVAILAAASRLVRVRAILVAPRGELLPGSLGLKRPKKQAFLRIWAPLLKRLDVRWHACSELERDHIRAIFPWARVLVVGNHVDTAEPLPPTGPNPGPLRLVFISRISASKNLALVLAALRDVTQPIDFDVFGPLQDARYWATCQDLMRQLPSHVRVRYLGALPPSAVAPTFSRYDAFVFPTIGENFGHVIIQSLAASCPVICSDHTPWSELIERARGLVVRPLTATSLAASLDQLAGMSPQDRFQARQEAGEAYRKWRLQNANRNVLDEARNFC